MQGVKRLGGRMLKRQADQADVGAVISEFKAADDMLTKFIKDLKAWRNEWEDVLRLQYDASEAFVTLYKPIEPTRNPDQRHVPTETPQRFMQKCLALQKMYTYVRQELSHELGLITSKVIKPVEEAKMHCKALHKTLKHRENMKLDYERYYKRAEHARARDQKSAKDEGLLAKCETDLAQAQIQYEMADEQVKETFPPVVESVYALMPYIAASQVMVHTTMVGQLYTSLDEYCRQQGFPSAPSDEEIISKWDGEYHMFRKELESSINIVAHGKAVHMPMALPTKSGTVTGLGIRNKVMGRKPEALPAPASTYKPASRPSITYEPPPLAIEDAPPAKPPRPGAAQIPSPAPGMISPGALLTSRPRIPSTSSTSSAPYDVKPTALIPGNYGKVLPAAGLLAAAGSQHSSSGHATPPSRYGTPMLTPGGSVAGAADYFNNAAAAANMANQAANALDTRRVSATSFASSTTSSNAAIAKKKPPPPVPVKRVPSGQPVQYVTALFDFEGQNAGDLAFKEGDRIRVVKKTGSTDDWWDGELAGRTGVFPANYVQV